MQMIRKNKFKWINHKFKNFIVSFFSEKYQFKYKNQIRICSMINKKFFEIFLYDIRIFDRELYLFIKTEPIECLNSFEFLINTLIKSFISVDMKHEKILKSIQIFLVSDQSPKVCKQLTSSQIEKLITIKIMILSVSRIRIKLGGLRIGAKTEYDRTIFFTRLKHPKREIKKINFKKNPLSFRKEFLSGINFVDFQIIKARDCSEKLLDGETITDSLFLLERNLVGLLLPGKTIEVTGIYASNYLNMGSKIKSLKEHDFNGKKIIHIVGFQKYYVNKSFIYSKKEILFDDDFLFFAKSGDIYDWIISSISPEIVGYNEIKAGVACLLFGSVTKSFSNFDGLNLLLIGNESNFKSSLFDFIKKIFPNIFKEKSSNFKLEQSDRIVSHNFTKRVRLGTEQEAFLKRGEIYGISDLDELSICDKTEILGIINKHIIKLSDQKEIILSTNKISILAGISDKMLDRFFFFDQEKTEFIYQIMQRFDLIFLVKKDPAKNKKAACDALKISSTNRNWAKAPGKIRSLSVEMLKKYIYTIRRQFCPILSKAASEFIKGVYIQMKMISRKNIENSERWQHNIKILQLESIIKISESLCKMKMIRKIFIYDTLEAIRLFNKRFINKINFFD